MNLKEKWASSEIQDSFVFSDTIFGVVFCAIAGFASDNLYASAPYLAVWVLAVYLGFARDFKNFGIQGWLYWILVMFLVPSPFIGLSLKMVLLCSILGFVAGTICSVIFLIQKCGVDKIKEYNKRMQNH